MWIDYSGEGILGKRKKKTNWLRHVWTGRVWEMMLESSDHTRYWEVLKRYEGLELDLRALRVMRSFEKDIT